MHSHFGEKVYRTVVPRNVRLAEAPSHGLPAMYFDKYSRGSKAYMALAGEIIRREEKLAAAQQPDALATLTRTESSHVCKKTGFGARAGCAVGRRSTRRG